MMFMPELQPTGPFEWTQAPGFTALRCRPLLAHADHLFTTRDLRLREDGAEWSAVARAVGVDVSSLRLIRQVHGVRAVADRPGGRAWTRPEADVVVSDDPSSAIAVRVADCAPVLLADTKRGVVGAAHAGWRGTAQRAAPAAVLAMREYFGSEPRDLMAAIGPCLGGCCGEVGPDVVDVFKEHGHGTAELSAWFAPGSGDRQLLSLARANRDQLAAEGVSPEQIFDAGLCTKTHAGAFHSYRADGASAGRMAAVIRARPRR